MATENNLIRVGRVSSIDASKMTARVLFADKDDMVSYDLPVIVPNTLKNKDYVMPDINEQVVCVFLANGLEQGYILGAIYSDKDTPPIGDHNIRHTSFEGGGFVEYDRKSGRLSIKAPGGINIDAPDITTSGKVISAGDMVAAGISLDNHVHGGVVSGGDKTAKPE